VIAAESGLIKTFKRQYLAVKEFDTPVIGMDG
jgi:hypothetical protein